GPVASRPVDGSRGTHRNRRTGYRTHVKGRDLAGRGPVSIQSTPSARSPRLIESHIRNAPSRDKFKRDVSESHAQSFCKLSFFPDFFNFAPLLSLLRSKVRDQLLSMPRLGALFWRC